MKTKPFVTLPKIRLSPAVLFPILATLLFVESAQDVHADVYPPAIQVNGTQWTGGGGEYSGSLSWAGQNVYGYIYTSGGIATLSGSVWQDGYYAGGWDTDFYGNETWDSDDNWVDGSFVPFSQTGSYSRGVFSISGLTVNATDGNGNAWPPSLAGTSTGNPVAGGPPELWVNGGQFYRYSTSDTDYYYSSDYYDCVAINGTSVTSDSLGVTGNYTPNAGGGVFVMSNSTVDLRPLAGNGSVMNTTTQSAYGPPGVGVNGQQWTFQGTVGGTDYYMGGAPGQLLTISNTLNVMLNDPATGVVSAAGYDNNGVYQDLPEPVRALDATGAVLASEGRGPASVIVNGAVWYHSGVGGTSYDAYLGAESGQELYMDGDAVWVSDSSNNINVSGTYADGAFQLLGEGVVVQAADAGGVAIPITPQSRAQSVASNSTDNGNIDIHGNLFTLGTWLDDPSTSGLCLSFMDQPPGNSTVPATISLVANRTLNQWMWSHATSSFTSTMPMMKLDASNSLTLYSSVDGTPQIVLNPQGNSTFQGAVTMQGAVHIQQRGDLTMGTFTSSPGQ